MMDSEQKNEKPQAGGLAVDAVVTCPVCQVRRDDVCPRCKSEMEYEPGDPFEGAPEMMYCESCCEFYDIA